MEASVKSELVTVRRVTLSRDEVAEAIIENIEAMPTVNLARRL
jgi:hypothetical protein